MPLLRFGRNSANATPAPSDNWLPVFGGEVITAFMENNVFAPLVNRKTIASGNSAEYPATWKIGAERHAAGTEMLGMDSETRKYVVTLDDRPIVSHFETDDVDVAMSHYDTRSEYTSQIGAALAREDDLNVARLLILASRTARGNSTNFPGGGIDGNGTAHTDSALNSVTPTTVGTAAHAKAVLDAISRVVPYWDTLDIPMTDRYMAVFPNLWHAIRDLTAFNGQTGTIPLIGHKDIDTTNPSIQAGLGPKEYLRYKGVNIFRSNNIPRTDESTTGYGQYAASYAGTKGVLFNRFAVAHLTLLGVAVETERDVRRQVDFSVAKMLTGGGTLRPYCSVEVASANGA